MTALRKIGRGIAVGLVWLILIGTSGAIAAGCISEILTPDDTPSGPSGDPDGCAYRAMAC